MMELSKDKVATDYNEARRNWYQVVLPFWFIVLVFAAACLFSFCLGINFPRSHPESFLGHSSAAAANVDTISLTSDRTRHTEISLSHLKDKRQNGEINSICEAMVHPAMLAHPNPTSVAIFGFRDKGWIQNLVKQVVQHESVQYIYLQEQTFDTSVFENRNQSISTKHAPSISYDIIFWDPRKVNYTIVKEELGDHEANQGILVAWIGIPDKSTYLLDITNELEVKDDFLAIRVFESFPHLVLVALPDDVTLGKWFASEAELNVALKKRMVSYPRVLDGSTIQMFQFPPRYVEELFCREKPTICLPGHGFDPEKDDVSIKNFYVNSSTIPNAGRGLFTNATVKEGSFMALEECVNSIHFPQGTSRILHNMYDHQLDDVMIYFVEGYGFENTYFGDSADVDSGIGTFVNHGCKGTNNVGRVKTSEHDSALADSIIDEEDPYSFNPYADRNARALDCSGDTFNEDLAAGTEIFSNYMTFFPRVGWEAYVDELRIECEGAPGLIIRHAIGNGTTVLDTEYHPELSRQR